MKRAMLTGLALVGAALLSGCPIYPEDRLVCETSLDCPDGYACSAATGYCYLPSGSGGGPNGGSCDEPKDCDFNETCTSKGVCKTGDCSFHGCVAGYTCAIDQGTWSCVAGGSGGADGGDAGSDAQSDGSAGSDASSGGTGGSAGSDAASGGSAGSDAATDGSAGSDAATD